MSDLGFPWQWLWWLLFSGCAVIHSGVLVNLCSRWICCLHHLPQNWGQQFSVNLLRLLWTKHCHISEKSNLHVVFYSLTMGIPFIMCLSIVAVKDILSHRKPSFTRNLQSIIFPAIHLTLFHNNLKVLTSPFKQEMHILKYFCDT